MRVVLAIVVAFLAAVTIELVVLFLAGLVAVLTGRQSMGAAAIAFQAGLVVAMFVGGGVAYEIARLRGAVAGFALVPLAFAVITILTEVAVRRVHLELGDTAVFVSALVSAVAALAGGAVWERHIRHAGPLD